MTTPLTARIVRHIESGGILHVGAVTCGPYRTACGEPQYAVCANHGWRYVDVAEWVADIFLGLVGTEAAVRALHADYLE